MYSVCIHKIINGELVNELIHKEKNTVLHLKLETLLSILRIVDTRKLLSASVSLITSGYFSYSSDA